MGALPPDPAPFWGYDNGTLHSYDKDPERDLNVERSCCIWSFPREPDWGFLMSMISTEVLAPACPVCTAQSWPRRWSREASAQALAGCQPLAKLS